jgi:3-dehydroquinate dehydratase
MNITRYQLIGLGLSAYQSTQITKLCPIQGKSKRQNLYATGDVIQQISTRLQQRIRKITKVILQRVLESLQEMTANVVAVPFGTANSETSAAVKDLLKSLKNPITEPHRLKALEITGKHAAHAR